MQSLVDRGVAAQDAGHPAEAERLYRQALAEDPGNVAAHYNLGLLLLDAGSADAAAAALGEAVRLRDSFAEAWVALAEALEGLGRDEAALAALDRAIALREHFEGALMNAAGLLQKVGRFEDSEAMYRRALLAAPGSAAAHNNLGNVLRVLRRLPEAEASLRQALAIEPGSAVAHSNLSNVLRQSGRPAEAEASAREAVRLAPDFPEAHNNLGTALQAQGRAHESAASLQRAIELRPGYQAAHDSLGNSLKDMGLLEEAEASFRSALALDPADRDARSNLLLLLNYSSRHSRERVHAEHLEWARLHEAPRGTRPVHANSRDPGRRLRIGYVSGDFRRHSVAYFIEPILAGHDRERFEVHCYSNVALPDRVTAHLLGLADRSHDLRGLGDEAAAMKIRDDGIDLLVDLSGHTAGNRLGVFALKPAPVQATYLGYPNTTGLDAIDWRITDAHADPVGEGESFHTETLMRLPSTFLSFQPPPDAPEVQAPPSKARGEVTFGSFNVLPKVTPEVIRAWSALLARLPRARLLLKSHGLGDEGSRSRLLQAFEVAGVPAARIGLLPLEGSLQSHLARYHEIDVALDPFPFNGTTTTLEALWMGVPVVSLRGDRHSGRVGSSILSTIGLESLIASDTQGYVELGARLAEDTRGLAALRASLRNRVAASALMDRAAFMRALEAAYREMWVRWCGRSDDPVVPG